MPRWQVAHMQMLTQISTVGVVVELDVKQWVNGRQEEARHFPDKVYVLTFSNEAVIVSFGIGVARVIVKRVWSNWQADGFCRVNVHSVRGRLQLITRGFRAIWIVEKIISFLLFSLAWGAQWYKNH